MPKRLTNAELADRVVSLERQVNALADGCIRQAQRTDRLWRAAQGDPCQHLGHVFDAPGVVLRNRVLHDNWVIAKICTRCGFEDGAWRPQDWTTPKLLAWKLAQGTSRRKGM